MNSLSFNLTQGKIFGRYTFCMLNSVRQWYKVVVNTTVDWWFEMLGSSRLYTELALLTFTRK